MVLMEKESEFGGWGAKLNQAKEDIYTMRELGWGIYIVKNEEAGSIVTGWCFREAFPKAMQLCKAF